MRKANEKKKTCAQVAEKKNHFKGRQFVHVNVHKQEIFQQTEKITLTHFVLHKARKTNIKKKNLKKTFRGKEDLVALFNNIFCLQINNFSLDRLWNDKREVGENTTLRNVRPVARSFLRLFLPSCQHIVKRIMTNRLSQSLHPVFLFLLGRGRHAIDCVLALDDFPLAVCFARFYEIRARCVQFKAVGLISIRSFAYFDIFQRYYPSRFLVRGVFKIVQAIVIQNKPAPFPALVPTALLPQPAFFIGIEKRVHEIVAIVFGNFERFGFYAVVKTLKKFFSN